MNKQLQRDLQCTIQSLKSSQLNNVLTCYQSMSETKSQRTITKKGVSFECEILFKNQVTKGYGRNQQESLSNATKNMLSVLVGKNIDVDKITKALKFKNGMQTKQFGTEKQMKYKYLSNEKQKNKDKEKDKDNKQNSLILDDISMIQANSRIDFFESDTNNNNYSRKNKQKQAPRSRQVQQSKDSCDCIFYEMNQYQNNEIKHLQARINLLTEQNMLLKKMLLCGNGNNSHQNHRSSSNYNSNNSNSSNSNVKDLQKHSYKKFDGYQKQNNFYQANTISVADSKIR